MNGLLHTIWQSDSAFPSGAFAFSNGLEGLFTLAPAAQLHDVLRDVVLRRWGSCDRVVLARAHRASGDLAAIAAADMAFEAATLVASLREGSRRHGAAYLGVHAKLGNATAGKLRAALRAGGCLGHLAVMQGAVLGAIGLDLSQAIAAAGYAAASGLVTAALRMGRVGAIEGQRALAAVLPDLAALAERPPAEDAELDSFLPLLDIAAARHPRATLRLFAT